jgi:hypothetical protein
MIFTATDEDNAIVGDFFWTMVRSACEVDPWEFQQRSKSVDRLSASRLGLLRWECRAVHQPHPLGFTVSLFDLAREVTQGFFVRCIIR